MESVLEERFIQNAPESDRVRVCILQLPDDEVWKLVERDPVSRSRGLRVARYLNERQIEGFAIYMNGVPPGHLSTKYPLYQDDVFLENRKGLEIARHTKNLLRDLHYKFPIVHRVIPFTMTKDEWSEAKTEPLFKKYYKLAYLPIRRRRRPRRRTRTRR